jgi:mono/diheme cytochrome c family protein
MTVLAGEASAQATVPLSRSAPALAGNAERGKDVYLRYSCYACHGYAGHGGATVRLVPMRLPLPAFSAFVRNPPSMPPYTAKVLSETQLADVWAYVKTLPESPPARSIPLLNQQ